MDDPRVAIPVYEKAQELGINLIGVHKGVPLGPQPVEAAQTWDMDGAAASFPDINFVIFHVGLPFIDETCWQLVRYPTLYASIAATINFVVRSPRQFAEWIGKLMFWCGEDKIIYGSETLIWHPKWALDAFWDFEIPQFLKTSSKATATSAHRTGQTQDPRREPPEALRHGRRRDKGQAQKRLLKNSVRAQCRAWPAPGIACCFVSAFTDLSSLRDRSTGFFSGRRKKLRLCLAWRFWANYPPGGDSTSAPGGWEVRARRAVGSTTPSCADDRSRSATAESGLGERPEREEATA